MKEHNYFVYVLTNRDRTVLYTGVTNNLDRRLAEHSSRLPNSENAFTRRYNIFYLIYFEWYKYIDVAIAREKEIKGWKRWKKEKMIATFNPEWRFFNDHWEIYLGNLPVWYMHQDYWRPACDKYNLDNGLT